MVLYFHSSHAWPQRLSNGASSSRHSWGRKRLKRLETLSEPRLLSDLRGRRGAGMRMACVPGPGLGSGL